MRYEPRQFSCFDDHNNDGWGNGYLDNDPRDLEEDEDEEIDDEPEGWENIDDNL